MAVAQIIKGDLKVEGSISVTGNNVPSTGTISNTHIASTAAIERSKLEQTTNAVYNVNLTDLRNWNAYATVLGATPATADDLSLVDGTFATGSPLVQTGDVKATSSTQYARFPVNLPAEYDDGETVTLRIRAGAETTVADGSMTLDVEAYEIDGSGGIGSDICATDAQSINSLTYGDKDFTITPSGLVAGDVLDVRIAIAYVDTATATAVIGSISKIQLLCDVRG